MRGNSDLPRLCLISYNDGTLSDNTPELVKPYFIVLVLNKIHVANGCVRFGGTRGFPVLCRIASIPVASRKAYNL